MPPRERTNEEKGSPAGEPLIFIEQNPSRRGSPSRRIHPDVRTRAAVASASTRKATMATKEAKKHAEFVGASRSQSPFTPSAATTPAVRDQNHNIQRLPNANRGTLNEFLENIRQLRNTNLNESISAPRQAVRSALWVAMSNSSSLFQASLLVANSFRNTCGKQEPDDQGISQLLLQGASLRMMQEAWSDPLVFMTIAMLASWERRFGEPVAYTMHIQALKSLPQPVEALDEVDVAALVDWTFEAFREALRERAVTTPIGSQASYHASMPYGFWIFDTHRRETRSMLDLVCRVSEHDYSHKDAVPDMRKLGMEIMAWSPHHTQSAELVSTIEGPWDEAELNALVHIRAVCFVIAGLLLKHSMNYHRHEWSLSQEGGLSGQAVAYQRLDTEPLLGTKFQDVAVWSRFILCAMSQEPENHASIKQFLLRLNLRTWGQLKAMLGRHVYLQRLWETKCSEVFELLMKQGLPQSMVSA